LGPLDHVVDLDGEGGEDPHDLRGLPGEQPHDVPSGLQCRGDVRADETGATGEQDLHTGWQIWQGDRSALAGFRSARDLTTEQSGR
jgi:hypothetical protein